MNYPPNYPPSGGNPQYGGFPPGPGGPPPRSTRWLWISLAAAAVVIVVLAGVVIAQQRTETTGTPTATATSRTSIAPQRSSTAPRSPTPSRTQQTAMTCEGYTVQLDATSPPGWQPTVGKRGLAYAVPPEWAVQACGVQLGWQKKPCPNGSPEACAVRAMSAAATLPSPSCGDGATLAMAGVAGSKTTDIELALSQEVDTVPLIYTPDRGTAPKVSLAPVRRFMVGSQPAVQTVATVTDIASTDGCTGRAALHSMVVTTVPNVEGTVVFIISMKQGIAGAPAPDVINQMVATLRSVR